MQLGNPTWVDHLWSVSLMVGFLLFRIFLRSNGLIIWQTSSRIIPNQWLSTCDDGFREEGDNIETAGNGGQIG